MRGCFSVEPPNCSRRCKQLATEVHLTSTPYEHQLRTPSDLELSFSFKGIKSILFFSFFEVGGGVVSQFQPPLDAQTQT